MTARIRTALAAGLVAFAMVGLAYASVPLYRLFCQVTGFGGTTQRAETGPTAADAARAAGRTVTVRFDGNTAPGVPWRFRPVQTTQTVAIGQRQLAFYRAQNPTSRATTGTATFNVSPDTAGKYFVKIDCFCFQEQTLAPGQSVDMPVLFYVDPAYLDDPDAAKVEEITLSYTFFPAEPEPTKTAAKSTATQG